MGKKIYSPGSYIQGNGELCQLAEYYQMLGKKGAYLIVDKYIFDTYQDIFESSFRQEKVVFKTAIFGGQCSMEEINKHRAELEEYDAIIGIGGGKTLDTSKAVAYYSDIPVMVVPTAASSDAPCSRLSAVYSKDGKFENYIRLSSNPDMVIMDTEIIAKAPVRFLMAGIGDAISTYYEASAYAKSNPVSMTAIGLAKLCRDTLIKDGLNAKKAAENGISNAALENIVEANTYLSGVGFESSGLAAAHAIHNGLTQIEETHRLLHGEIVAFGTICQLVLEDREIKEIVDIATFLRRCGLPISLKDLGIENIENERLMEVARISCGEHNTMSNMPFNVKPIDVFAAIKKADQLGRTI